MYELNFLTDLVEERLATGKLRWLANFKEIRKDYKIGEITVPIYATGGLEEKGFLLSRVFSAFVTPKYKIHFLFYTAPEITVNFLRKFVIACKNKFKDDDWIFIGLVQSKPLEKTLKKAVENIADKRVGIAVYSLASKAEAFSKNVLGKALHKQLKLTEATFEAFYLPAYLKSFAMPFILGVLILVMVTLFGGVIGAIQPVTLLVLAFASIIVGHQIYKTQYRVTLTLNSKGFELKEGKTVTKGKWSDYTDLTIYITPGHETCLRLYSKEKTLDLPLSKMGISRKNAYNMIKQLVKRRS